MVNNPCAFENQKCVFCSCLVECPVNVTWVIWLMVLFKSLNPLLIFCLHGPSIIERGMLKAPALIVDPSPFNLLVFATRVLKLLSAYTFMIMMNWKYLYFTYIFNNFFLARYRRLGSQFCFTSLKVSFYCFLDCLLSDGESALFLILVPLWRAAFWGNLCIFGFSMFLRMGCWFLFFSFCFLVLLICGLVFFVKFGTFSLIISSNISFRSTLSPRPLALTLFTHWTAWCCSTGHWGSLLFF